MTYIGQQPATTFDSGIQDRFTGLTTNTVTLNHEISAEEDILVVWNNIVQDKNSYSVGGTGNKTVTLGGTLVSGDVVTVYYLNKVMQSVNPTAGSVGITELNFSDGSNGQALTTNGSGTLSFATVSADADNYFASSGLSSKDLGSGLHIKTADSGTSSTSAIQESDELILEGTAEVGMGIISSTSGSGSIYFSDSGASNGRIVYYHGDDSFRFVTSGGEGLRITSNKSIALGTSWDTWYRTQIRFNGNAGGGIVLDNSETDTNGTAYIYFKQGNATIGSINRNGTTSAVSYNTSSDYRLKEAITDKTDGIEKIKLLKPRKFKWKSDPSNQIVDGFIAHEVSDIVPEAITGEKDAMIPEILYTADDELPDGKSIGDVKEATKINPQQIDQAKLVPLLTSALKEAITKIETLEARVKTLEDA